MYKKMAASIRGARLEVFSEAGHALFVDEPERFNGLVEEVMSAPGAKP
jgi:pimeloyl-ACP methyl ester carboxylesterase